jgi:hypothetical protein
MRIQFSVVGEQRRQSARAGISLGYTRRDVTHDRVVSDDRVVSENRMVKRCSRC